MIIIAEIGVNHDGDLARAVALVDACVRIGAHFAKFQVFNAATLATSNVARASYQERAIGSGSQFEMLRRLELTHAEFAHLNAYCAQVGIGFLATTPDVINLDFLTDELRCKTVKIGSGDLDNLPLLIAAASKGVDIILSTGMSDDAEIDLALDAMAFGRQVHERGGNYSEVVANFPTRSTLAEAGQLMGRAGLARFVTLLHCTSEYPAAHASLNMKAIVTMRERLAPIAIGYSDHSTDHVGAIMAAALGATMMERHLTYDRAADGPDHAASLNEAEFAEMVKLLTISGGALGTGQKAPTKGELEVRAVARKRVIAARPLKAGDILTFADAVMKRASSGRFAKDLPDMIGKPVAHSVGIDEPIQVTMPISA